MSQKMGIAGQSIILSHSVNNNTRGFDQKQSYIVSKFLKYTSKLCHTSKVSPLAKIMSQCWVSIGLQ